MIAWRKLLLLAICDVFKQSARKFWWASCSVEWFCTSGTPSLFSTLLWCKSCNTSDHKSLSLVFDSPSSSCKSDTRWWRFVVRPPSQALEVPLKLLATSSEPCEVGFCVLDRFLQCDCVFSGDLVFQASELELAFAESSGRHWLVWNQIILKIDKKSFYNRFIEWLKLCLSLSIDDSHPIATKWLDLDVQIN